MTETNATPLRTCTKCKIAKPHSEYTKVSRTVIGLSARCKACAAQYARDNQDRINAMSLALYHKNYAPTKEAKAKARQARIDAPDKKCSGCKAIKAKTEFADVKGTLDGKRAYCIPCKALESRKYREKNYEKSRESSRNWVKNNPEKKLERQRRRQAKISNRVNASISSRMYSWFKGRKQTKGGKTKEHLGYGWDELKIHIEKQFLPGMSWDNYGEWHIDHIRPLVEFHAQSLSDPIVKIAWGLANLRPLWAVDNLKKNAKRLFLI